jgi:hypothetical protein
MTLPSAVRWFLLAVAGLAVAIGVAIAASELTSERIGLSSEPIRAGESLAPAADRNKQRRDGDRSRRRSDGEVTTTTVTPTTTTESEAGDDDGGDGGDGKEEEEDDD